MTSALASVEAAPASVESGLVSVEMVVALSSSRGVSPGTGTFASTFAAMAGEYAPWSSGEIGRELGMTRAEAS